MELILWRYKDMVSGSSELSFHIQNTYYLKIIALQILDSDPTITMVSFSHLIISAFAITGSLSSPTASDKREPANFSVGGKNGLQARQNYQQNYQTGGDVIFSPSGNYFKVQWDTQDDFVCGIGWTTGSYK